MTAGMEALHELNSLILIDYKDISTREHNSSSLELELEDAPDHFLFLLPINTWATKKEMGILVLTDSDCQEKKRLILIMEERNLHRAPGNLPVPILPS